METIGLHRNYSIIWKLRWYIFGLALISLICVTSSTFLLYCYYGELTPNGNRYHHPFNIETVQWNLVLLSAVAYLILAYPSIRLPFSQHPEWHKWGIFPAKRKFSSFISGILTFLNIMSGGLFCLLFCIETRLFIVEADRVMAEDLESILLAFCYLSCTVFWAIPIIIYSVHYKLKW